MGKLRTLVSSMLRIGLIGFGGGNALIPVIEKEIVEEKALITRSEYEEDIVVASITPGALPVELAGGIGKRIAGGKGMILGAVSMAFPGVFLTLIMISAMSGLSESAARQIEFLAVGITAFISCLLTDYIIGAIKEGKRQNILSESVVMMAGVFLLTCGKNLYRILGVEASPIFGLATIDVFVIVFFVIFYTNGTFTRRNVPVFLILCGVYIADQSRRDPIQNQIVSVCIRMFMLILALCGLRRNLKADRKMQKVSFKELRGELAGLILFVAVTLCAGWCVSDKSLQYAWNGILSSLMSFGGGDAYLTVADGLFVQSAFITEDEFYSSLVPIVNILPGSILCKTLSGIGYYLGYDATGSIMGGYVVALVGFACSIAGSCGVFAVIGNIYGNFEQLSIFRVIKKWIRPIVAGLMFTVILSLIYQNCKLGMTVGQRLAPVLYMVFIYMIDLFLYYKMRMKTGNVALISAILSFGLCNLLII